MTSEVFPQVSIIAETQLDQDGMCRVLDILGASHWGTDAAAPAETLIEFAGKLCYMSFSTDLNKNLTKVGTKNNHDYIANSIVANHHGSVLEHATVTFCATNVSRIFTHELVRHRAGTAFSQVSGRYVRIDSIDAYIPQCIADNPEAEAVFRHAFTVMEDTVAELSRILKIDEMTDFAKKKEVTSALRRIIGNGQANHIVFTANHRAIRHMIAMRTAPGAEEEIVLVFDVIARMMKERYPAIYADMVRDPVTGAWVFAHDKV